MHEILLMLNARKIHYEDIIVSLNYYFSEKINELQNWEFMMLFRSGFGFGKTVEDQYKMIEEVEHLGFGRFPLLIGISRKSFIYKPLNKNRLRLVKKPKFYTEKF